MISSQSPTSTRAEYAQALAAYTLRQFSAAHVSLDQHKAAAAKLPAEHKRHLALLEKTSWVSHLYVCIRHLIDFFLKKAKPQNLDNNWSGGRRLVPL